jgi:hypothetical protein
MLCPAYDTAFSNEKITQKYKRTRLEACDIQILHMSKFDHLIGKTLKFF